MVLHCWATTESHSFIQTDLFIYACFLGCVVNIGAESTIIIKEKPDRFFRCLLNVVNPFFTMIECKCRLFYICFRFFACFSCFYFVLLAICAVKPLTRNTYTDSILNSFDFILIRFKCMDILLVWMFIALFPVVITLFVPSIKNSLFFSVNSLFFFFVL